MVWYINHTNVTRLVPQFGVTLVRSTTSVIGPVNGKLTVRFDEILVVWLSDRNTRFASQISLALPAKGWACVLSFIQFCLSFVYLVRRYYNDRLRLTSLHQPRSEAHKKSLAKPQLFVIIFGQRDQWNERRVSGLLQGCAAKQGWKSVLKERISGISATISWANSWRNEIARILIGHRVHQSSDFD